jgi:hypothetical protein
MDTKLITHLFYRLFKAKPSGLTKAPKDPRDYQADDLGWGFGYQPVNKVKVLKTLGVKDQGDSLCCQWFASAVCKEIDEGVELSPRSIAAKGYYMGLAGNWGLSNLNNGQKVMKDWGIVEESACNSKATSWAEYINVNFKLLDPKASEHKLKTYWSVNGRSAIFQAIDGDHPITTGMDWYTGFNQGGGFAYPWIISKASGYRVGGHAVALIGYDIPAGVYVFQNSYGKNWGGYRDSNGVTHPGCFAVSMSYFDSNNYGCVASLDIEYDATTGEDYAKMYDGKNIRGDKQPTIYRVYDGKKYAYKNAAAFIAYNGQPYTYKDSFVVAPQKIVDSIPNPPAEGGVLTGELGPYWDMVKNLRDPKNNNFIDKQ